MNRLVAFAATTVLLGQSIAAEAEDGTALNVLLPKLAASAERFESRMRKASFTIDGHIETVGSDGVASDRRAGTFRVHGGGKRRHVEALRYTEDGEDKIDNAREKLKADEEKEPEDDTHLPFLASEQPKYTFRVLGTDAADRARVRIEFNPKEPDKKLVAGSAWVDAATGNVLTMGFTPSKTGIFVDYLRVTLEFGEVLDHAPAVSRVSFEGSGGFLFFHRRFRGAAKLSKYEVAIP